MEESIVTEINALSVVLPVNERGENLIEILGDYRSSLSILNIVVEYIVVLTPQYAYLIEDLEAMVAEDPSIKVIVLNRNYGEAGELKIGVDHAKHEFILTLPAYKQVDSSRLPELIKALAGYDVLAVNRWPRIDPVFNKIQSFIFRGIFKVLAYNAPKDPGSGIRLCRKEVFDDVKLYGDLHRFFPILAENSGFTVLSMDIPQSESDAYQRVYSLRIYLTRFLDILTVVFLTRFNKKPLRFFGAGGAISSGIGVLGLAFIAAQKIFFGIPAGDRPLLVLFSLFLVLGVQLIAIGLVGETVIFTSSKKNKEYRVRKIIN